MENQTNRRGIPTYINSEGCIILDDITITRGSHLPVNTQRANSDETASVSYVQPPFHHRHHHNWQYYNHRPSPLPQTTQMSSPSLSRYPLNNRPYRQSGVGNHPVPRQTNGVRVMSQPRHSTVQAATSRHRAASYLRSLPDEETAILEFQDYPQLSDLHRDVHVNVEHMSYEELVEMGNRIGNVNTGLTDEAIRRHLKTRTLEVPLVSSTKLEEDPDICIICQCDYEHEDTIATLGCGHEYHQECLVRWLLEKNVCPVCKSSALPR